MVDSAFSPVSPEEGRAYLEVIERYFEVQLERGRRFVWSLTVPLPEDSYKLIVFGGDCRLTPARLLVEEVNGVSEVRLWPREISKPLPRAIKPGSAKLIRRKET